MMLQSSRFEKAAGFILATCGIFLVVASTISVSVLWLPSLKSQENNTPTTDTTYYQPAEVVAYNDTSVYFGTPENQIYYTEKNGFDYPDTVPYLLHMDTIGTEDTSDDQILVAWRCVDYAENFI